MSFDGVSPSEMKALRHVTPQDVDRLLSGRVPAAGAELDDLTAFFRDLGKAFQESRVEGLEAKHLAAMMAAASETVIRQPPVPSRTGVPRSRPSGLLFSLKRKIVAVSTAGLTAFSGMAVAGVLPAPLQRVVADAAGRVGIHLPGRTRVGSPPLDDRQLRGPSDDVADPAGDAPDGGSGKRREKRPAGDRERGGASGGGAVRQDEDAADEERDREEDAADEARDAKEEAADKVRDREKDAADEADDAEEDAGDEERDREEDAADEAEDAEEDAAEDREDATEDAADEAAGAEEEVEPDSAD